MSALTTWNPAECLEDKPIDRVNWSRGFLQCSPEKWLPGFSTAWMPLTHSLSIDCRVVSITPHVGRIEKKDFGYVGTVDDEPIGLFFDTSSAGSILTAFCPGAFHLANDIVLEYLSRRFVSALAMSWSGPESSTVQFDENMRAEHVSGAGSVSIKLELNGRACEIVIVLGKILINKLDGLWRRQIQSADNRNYGENLVLEITQLAVPPSLLSDYTKAGTVVDLEIPVTTSATLTLDRKPWKKCNLTKIGDNFGIEIADKKLSSLSVPEGTTRLYVELGKVQADKETLTELSQIGAMLDTGIPLTDKVDLVINTEKVAEAKLSIYEGRFAISIQ